VWRAALGLRAAARVGSSARARDIGIRARWATAELAGRVPNQGQAYLLVSVIRRAASSLMRATDEALASCEKSARARGARHLF
jgi:hypothetical protein